jgi:hypothetical protein
MKNIIFSIIFLFIFCGCVSTEKRNSNGILNENRQDSLQFIADGSYAFYSDNRYESIIYRGYMKFTSADNQVGIVVRNINANTGLEERFIFVIGDDVDGFPTIIKNIGGQISSMESRQAIPDFINFSTLYLKTKDNYEKQSEIDDDWGDFILVFSFDKSLPFFRFSEIKLKGDNNAKYELLHGGLLKNINFESFFGLNYIN